jgi:hypothetical protein
LAVRSIGGVIRSDPFMNHFTNKPNHLLAGVAGSTQLE